MFLEIIMPIQKSVKTLNTQGNDYLKKIESTKKISNKTRKDISFLFNISDSLLGKITTIFSHNPIFTKRTDIISILFGGLDQGSFQEITSLSLKDKISEEGYLKLIQQDFPDTSFSKEEIKKLSILYKFYESYKEFLTKQRVNKTTLGHTLKYNTSVQHLKHRIPDKYGKFGTGDYFLDTNEQFVMMKENKTPESSKLSINKYFGPIWIRIKETTDATVRDINEINAYNKDKMPIPINAGHYIIEFDVSPHSFEGGKPLQQGYKALADYLQHGIYDEIIENNAEKHVNTKKEDITFDFIFGITALTALAKRYNRNIRKIPVNLAKKTATYMYGLINPHGKYSEQPALLKFTAPDKYKQLEKMADKFDVRDITFTYTTPEDFIKGAEAFI